MVPRGVLLVLTARRWSFWLVLARPRYAQITLHLWRSRNALMPVGPRLPFPYLRAYPVRVLTVRLTAL